MQDFRTLCKTVARVNGLKFISKGYYSRVYGNENVVMKIINNVEDQQDTLAFLRYAKKHCDSNPFLPKVRNITEGEEFAIVTMEKLSKARWQARERSMEKIAGYGSGEMLSGRDLEYAYKYTQDANLKQVLKYLNGRILRTGARLDLHQWNYLWRGKQIVITDPFAS